MSLPPHLSGDAITSSWSGEVALRLKAEMAFLAAGGARGDFAP